MRRALVVCALAGVVGASALAASAGVPGSAASAATATTACTVSKAKLTWGFKESFRSYISGSIAKGSWAVADGTTYTTPSFSWTNGVGSLVDGVGTVQYTGSIHFTGHEGVLDTTVANPALRFDGGPTATLLLDVKGETMDGVATDKKAIPFATVTLKSKDPALISGGTATLEAATTTLTTEGSAAFGSYEAGTALDPIDTAVPVACPTPSPSPSPSPSPDAEVASTAAAAAPNDASAESGPTPGVIATGGGLLVALAAAAVVAVARWRRTRPSDPESGPSSSDTTPGGPA